MAQVTRFGVSLDPELLRRFDRLIDDKGYANRSEAIRDLIREVLVRQEWEGEKNENVGTITMIYDHHSHDAGDKLADVQHDHHRAILSTMHIHLDHDNCLEVLAVKGSGRLLRQLADELISLKGVKHGKLVATTTGKHL